MRVRVMDLVAKLKNTFHVLPTRTSHREVGLGIFASPEAFIEGESSELLGGVSIF